MDPPLREGQNEATAWAAPEFIPRRALSQRDVQTIIGSLWPRGEGLPAGQGLRVDVGGGNAVTAVCNWQQDRAGSSALVLVHGLEGDAGVPFVRGLAHKALRAGHHAVRMNMRTCGGTFALSRTLYHSGLSGDVDAVVRTLLRDCGVKRVGVVGYSMGGNMVLKMAGEWGRKPPPGVTGVVAVCPAVDLSLCATLLHTPRNRPYETYFLLGLLRRFQQVQRQWPDVYGSAFPSWPRSLRDWDDRITAHYSGFSGVEDYYSRASAREVLRDIHVPTLVLHALDDPFVQLTPSTRDALVANSNVRLVETPHGGHCGFLSNGPPGDPQWAEATAVDFLHRLEADA